MDSLNFSAVSYQSHKVRILYMLSVVSWISDRASNMTRCMLNELAPLEISRIWPAPTSAGRHPRDDENAQRLVAAHSED